MQDKELIKIKIFVFQTVFMLKMKFTIKQMNFEKYLTGYYLLRNNRKNLNY